MKTYPSTIFESYVKFFGFGTRTGDWKTESILYFHFALPSIGCRFVEDFKCLSNHQENWIYHGNLN